MESPTACPTSESLLAAHQYDMATSICESVQQTTTFTAQCSPSKTSRALDPERLPLPKPVKAWDRVARPPADPDSRVKVVWERHALRRQTQKDVNDRSGDYRIGGRRNTAEIKVVKRRRVGMGDEIRDDNGRRSYVATRSERRQSRGLQRKLPPPSSNILEDRSSSTLGEPECPIDTGDSEQQNEDDGIITLGDPEESCVVSIDQSAVRQTNPSLQHFTTIKATHVPEPDMLPIVAINAQESPEAMITDELPFSTEGSTVDPSAIYNMEIVVLPSGSPGADSNHATATPPPNTESSTVLVSLEPSSNVHELEPETIQPAQPAVLELLPNDVQFFGETPEMQIETLRMLALPNTHAEENHAPPVADALGLSPLEMSFDFSLIPSPSRAADDSAKPLASEFSIADTLERPASFSSVPLDSHTINAIATVQSPSLLVPVEVENEGGDEDDDGDASDDLSDSNDDVDCAINPDELTRSLSSTFATTLANAAATTPLDDDKAILSSFLARAAASKASRAARVSKRASLQNQVDSDIVRQALASPRPALEDKDVNLSPSKIPASPPDITPSNAGLYTDLKSGAEGPPVDLTSSFYISDPPEVGTPTGANNDEASTANLNSPSLRRSSRRPPRNLNATASQSPKKIAVRRTDGNDPLVLAEMQEAKKLANLTRNNTRKNKGGAMGPMDRLVELRALLAIAKEGCSAATQEEAFERTLSAKGIRWNETLATYQEAPVFEASPRKGRAVRKAPVAKLQGPPIDPKAIPGMVIEAAQPGSGTEGAQTQAQSLQQQQQGAAKKPAQTGLRRLRPPQPIRGAPGKAVLASTVLPDEVTTTAKEAAQPHSGKEVSSSASIIANISSITPAEMRERKTRLPPPPSATSKKSTFTLAPGVTSITGAIAMSEGKENQSQTLTAGAKSSSGTRKLVSPKKISLLRMPIGAPGMPGPKDEEHNQQQQSMSGALGTPARKRVGVRRKQ